MQHMFAWHASKILFFSISFPNPKTLFFFQKLCMVNGNVRLQTDSDRE